MSRYMGRKVNPSRFDRSQIRSYVVLIPIAFIMILPIIYVIVMSCLPILHVSSLENQLGRISEILVGFLLLWEFHFQGIY